MVWRTIASAVTHKTPFLILESIKDFEIYVRSNKPFVVRNNRVYSVVTPDFFGQEIQVEFLDVVLFDRTFTRTPQEYLDVLALCYKNFQNLLDINPENEYNQQVSFNERAR